jgi:hypothetical protein
MPIHRTRPDLLRPRCERPGDGCAAKHTEKLAPLHVKSRLKEKVTWSAPWGRTG